MASPDVDNGCNLADILKFGFAGLDRATPYLCDAFKLCRFDDFAIAGGTVIFEGVRIELPATTYAKHLTDYTGDSSDPAVLRPPGSGTRSDALYLDMRLLDELAGRRPELRIAVFESAQTDYTDADGYRHYVERIAEIERTTSRQITPAMLTDCRVTYATKGYDFLILTTAQQSRYPDAAAFLRYDSALQKFKRKSGTKVTIPGGSRIKISGLDTLTNDLLFTATGLTIESEIEIDDSQHHITVGDNARIDLKVSHPEKVTFGRGCSGFVNAEAVCRSEYRTPAKIITAAAAAAIYYRDTGTANALHLTPGTPSANIGALTDGMAFLFSPAHPNTGAATLKLGGLPPKSMKLNGSDLAPGALIVGVKYLAVYSQSDDAFHIDAIAGAGGGDDSEILNSSQSAIGTLPIGATMPVGGTYTTRAIVLPKGVYIWDSYGWLNQFSNRRGSGFYFNPVLITGSGFTTFTYRYWPAAGKEESGKFYTGVLKVFSATAQVVMRYRSDPYSGWRISSPNSEATYFTRIR